MSSNSRQVFLKERPISPLMLAIKLMAKLHSLLSARMQLFLDEFSGESYVFEQLHAEN